MNSLLKDLPENDREKLKRKKQPSWISPMLATLTHNYFDDDNWIYERKFDGERCLVFKNHNTVNLKSRNKKILNNKYPEITSVFRKQRADQFIIDGELVTFAGKKTSFERLQERMQVKKASEELQKKVKVFIYVFDILFFEGYDTTCMQLSERKNLLKAAFNYEDPLRFTIHKNKYGVKYRSAACKKGWEGVIAKKADATYINGRSKDWLKFKCSNRQEFVIGGFTEPKGNRTGFGALLIGYYDKDDLRYAGKIGTGYDEDTLKMLHRKLSSFERKTSPFSDGDIQYKGVHWVTPKFVCEAGFTEWTKDNKLRHPRYLGLRDDKNAEKVVKEKPLSS